MFSNDSELIALNSCYFYNGAIIGVAVADLPGLYTAPYEEHPKVNVIEEGAGVYRNDEFIIGDASGYQRAFGKDGTPHWQHHIGSSVGDIDVSADGKTLAPCVLTPMLGFYQFYTWMQADLNPTKSETVVIPK